MASGKKNYFRHSFFARNDTKLRELRQRVGVGFYFYYFSLLEQCGEVADGENQIHFELHSSLIRNLWCRNLKKCESICDQMNAVGLLDFKKVSEKFYFTIPNFPKYLGKYETNLTKEKKRNEIKENKSKGNSFSSFLSPPSLNERDAVPIEFKKEFGKKLLESNWGKNHDFYYANNVKKDYFEFQRECLIRSREKFGDELQDKKDVINYLKQLEEKHEQIRRDIKSKKENPADGSAGEGFTDKEKQD